MHSDTRNMTARAWLTGTIGTTVLMVAVAVLVNMRIDIYGIFRNDAGRRLAVYGDERIAKYLLNEKYVPENFDTLLIGSSVSGNWNTGGIEALHVYNESLDGGNIVEEKAIADQALAGSHIRVAILIVHPYLTSSHEFETVPLTPRENFGALGSESLLDAYKAAVRVRLHLEEQVFDAWGTHYLGDAPMQLNPTLQKLMAPGAAFDVDETAMASYRALVDELHASGIPIIYVVPPLSQKFFDVKPDAFAAYSKIALAGMAKQDKVIDFTSDAMASFRTSPEDYIDGVHMKDHPAQGVVAAINRQVNDWIQAGELPKLR